MGGHRELTMPTELVAAAAHEGREQRLTTLPATIQQLEAMWSIVVEEPFQPGGQTAWVAPVRGGGADLVVKVLWRHAEAEHEADGLRAWDGNGAVRLHAACEVSAETTALLLERCRPGTALRALPEPEQDLMVVAVRALRPGVSRLAHARRRGPQGGAIHPRRRP